MRAFTLDGRLCKFNDDRVNTDNQVLMNAYSDDGAAIRAEWATKLDTMGSISELKRLNKRGTSVHLKSYARSGIQVWIRTEKDPGKMYRVLYADTFNFEDIAFYRLTFDGTRNAMRPLNTKIDDWKAIQFWLISEGVNEGFGLYEVEASYMVIKEAKQ